MKIDTTEEKYRLLWATDKVHAPFMYAVDLIRKKWNLSPLNDKSTTYEQARNIYTVFMESLFEVSDEKYSQNYQRYNTLVELLRKADKINEFSIRGTLDELPIIQYFNDIERLCDLFLFHRQWLFSLSFYVVTNKIMVPKDSFIKNNIPPPTIVDQIKIFVCDLDKQTNPNSTIKTDRDIAKHVFNTSKYFEEFDLVKIKQYRHRYRKSPFFIKLTPEIKSALDLLFS